MGFSRQEYWNELLFPSPGDLPDPGIKPSLLHCRQILYPCTTWEAQEALEKLWRPLSEAGLPLQYSKTEEVLSQ